MPEDVVDVAFTAPSDPGTHRARVVIETDDSKSPQQVLQLVAEVKALIEAVPRSVIFTGERSEARIQVVHVSNRTDSQNVFPELVWDGPGANPFRIDSVALEEGKTATIRVEFNQREAPVLPCRGVLRIAAGGIHRDVPLVALR